jgi:transcriptional regulator of arginine metabolism
VHALTMPVSAEQRAQRQQAILQILRRRQVSTQEELVELLRKKGFEVTQSSVSRDLRQLGIAKLGQEYRPVDDEVEPGASRDLTLSAEFVREVRTAGPNITVVKTVEGAAGKVGLSVDRAGWNEVVGTIAGDDTIFVATRTAADQRRLVARLKTHFGP